MVCVYCSSDTKVVNSRSTPRHPLTWRRRKCNGCHALFTTIEEPDFEKNIRIKKPDGTLEPFYRDKLFICLNESLGHREQALLDSRAVINTVIKDLLGAHLKTGVIDSRDIIGVVSKTLKRYDKPAFVHYQVRHPLN